MPADWNESKPCFASARNPARSWPGIAQAATCATFFVALLAVPAVASAQSFTFAPAATRACTASHYPTRVVVTDVDGDGGLDLLVPGRDVDGLVNWAPLTPVGTPDVMQWFQCTGQTDAVVIGDLNADARADLAFAVRSTRGRTAVYLRTEDGLPAEPLEFSADRDPRALVSGDWNGDGAIDLASLQYGNNVLLVLANDGAGNMNIVQRLPLEPWSGGTPGPQELMVGDVNADGRLDLVASMVGSRRINVFMGMPLAPGESGEAFAMPVAWEALPLPDESKPGVTTAALGDVDGDGDLDVVATLIATAGAQPVMVFVNDGTGGFAERVRFDGPESGYGWGTALGDLDGDGDLDIVTGTALPGGLFVWENTTPVGASVHFEPPQQIGTGTFIRDICIANVDGDCDLDIVYAEIGNNTVRVYRQLRECGMAALMLPGDDATTARDASGRDASGRDASASAAAPSDDVARLIAAVNRVTSRTHASAGELAALLASFGPSAHAGYSPEFAHLQGGGLASCGPLGEGGRCDEPHATPGCFTTPCCEAVCEFDPACCNTAWDQLCVDIAAKECDGLVCPQYGACNEVHLDPGCEDPDCCARITRIDGYCQSALWDRLCVEKAAALCGTLPCTLMVPVGAIPEGEACYQTLNDGPNMPTTPEGRGPWFIEPQCGETYEGTCATGSPRDTDWFRLPGFGKRTIEFTVASEFPSEVHLVRGEFTGPLQLSATTFGGQCAPVTLTACLPDDGPWYAVVTLGTPAEAIRRGQPCLIEDPRDPWPKDYDPVPGFDGYRYAATLTCAGCGQPADLNRDGTVNGADLGMLLAAWGLTGQHAEDLDGNGVVNGADLGILLAAWGPVLD